MFDSGSAELRKHFMKFPNLFRRFFGGNLNILKIENYEKTCAGKSLRSVLSDLGNLAYGNNIYKKT